MTPKDTLFRHSHTETLYKNYSWNIKTDTSAFTGFGYISKPEALNPIGKFDVWPNKNSPAYSRLKSQFWGETQGSTFEMERKLWFDKGYRI